MKKQAIVVIGIGHHARRIYVPELTKHRLLNQVVIIFVDISEAAPVISKYVSHANIGTRVDVNYLNKEDRSNFEESQVAAKIVSEYDILGVFISTDPLNHMQYARWALRNNFHVFSDKPLSTHVDVVHCEDAAANIRKDYEEIVALYNKSSSMFCLSTQRRYEAGYSFAAQKLQEVAQRFGMPVTSAQSFYSDGLWIFPDELLNQKVHPFNQGYGMLSHSGFHMLDALWSFYTQGAVGHKRADAMEVHASAIYPEGYIKNFGAQDYSRTFGGQAVQHDDAFYGQHFKGFGEMDIMGNFMLQKDSAHIASMSVKLLHNGFSRRSWSKAREDLYKGNGRVKHQTFTIEQGPFQCIQLHNYQAVAEHDNATDTDTYDLGGKNHFDIHIFRNADMFGNAVKPVEKFSSSDIEELYKDESRLSNEIAKSLMIDEFIGNCIAIKKGEKTRDTVEMRNGILSYDVPVKMMASLYRSLALRKSGKNALVEEAL